MNTNQIRFKPDFLPTSFVSEEFDGLFLSALTRSFGGILERRAVNNKMEWEHFTSTLRKHGLLALKVPTEFTPEDIHIEILEKDGSVRHLTHVWKEPLPFGFEHLDLPIEHSRLAESGYIDETARILAYLFAWRLFAGGFDPQDVLIIANLDSVALDLYMRDKHAGEVSSRSLRLFLLERAVFAELESSDAFECFDRLKESFKTRWEHARKNNS